MPVDRPVERVPKEIVVRPDLVVRTFNFFYYFVSGEKNKIRVYALDLKVKLLFTTFYTGDTFRGRITPDGQYVRTVREVSNLDWRDINYTSRVVH